MASGSIRKTLVGDQLARRTRRRRMTTWAWIVAAGCGLSGQGWAADNAPQGIVKPMPTANNPAASSQQASRPAANRLVPMTAEPSTAIPGTAIPATAAPAQSSPTNSPPARLATRPVVQAIGVDADAAGGDEILQTSGGFLDQVFGGGFGDGSSSKPKDDGRKAFPLPPPDPASVDWSGVPFHKPSGSLAAESGGGSGQPLRDVSPTYRSSAPSTARRTAPSLAGPPSAPPESPAVNSQPTWDSVRQLRTPTTVAEETRVATAPASELSSNSSSRRSGRKPIDPLEADTVAVEIAAPPAKLNTTANTTGIPTLPRPPAEKSVLTKAPAPVAATQKADRRELPPLPPSISGMNLADVAKPEPVQKKPVPAADDVFDQPELSDVAKMAVPDLAPLKLPNETQPELEMLAEDPITGTATPLRSLVDETESESFAAIPTADIAAEAATDNEVADGEAEFMGSGVASEQIANRFPVRPRDVIASPATQSVMIGRPVATTDAVVKRLATSEGAAVRVVTEGPSEVLIRQVTQYELRVENRGSTNAAGIVVRTALPPWAELKGQDATAGSVRSIGEDGESILEWTVDELPAGTVEKLFVRVRAVQAGTFDVATRWTTAPLDQTATVTVLEPKLAVKIDGPDEIVFGQSQRYRIRVLNPGDGVASNVLFNLLPEASEPISQKLGNIPPGKESSFEIELTARDRGDLGIRGNVSGDLDLAAEIAKSVSVISADLEAIFSGPPVQFQNAEGTYELELVNSGKATAESVEAEIRLPEGMTYVDGIDGARTEGNRVVWTIPSIPAGETRQFAFACQLAKTGNHKLSFRCQGTAGGQASVELETAVQAIVDLKLTVIDPPVPAPVGAEVAYEVVIQNRGSKAAENVRVVGQFGHGIEPIRTEGHAGKIATGQVLFSPIAKIEPGSKVQLRIIAKADAAGDHRFRAEVHSGESVLVAEEATVYVDMTRQRVSRSGSGDTSR